MQLKKLTRQDVMNLADTPQVFRRGQEYYESGAIHQFSLQPDGIKARISGYQGNYTIRIKQSAEEIEFDCNCPYDGEICKHMVAVLLHYIEGGYQQRDPVDGREVPAVLRQALQAYTQPELLNLIEKIASENAEFRRTLLANVTIPSQVLSRQPSDARKVSYLKREINAVLKQIRDLIESSYDYEYQAEDTFEELEPIIEVARTLNLNEQLEVYWHFLEAGESFFQDYPLPTAQLEQVLALYARSVADLELSKSERQAQLARLTQILKWGMLDYGNIEQALGQALATIAKTEEDYRYLIRQLERNGDPLSVNLAAEYYLKLGDQAGYLGLRQSNLKSEEDYLELARYWLLQGDKNSSLVVLEEWAARLARGEAPAGFEPVYYMGDGRIGGHDSRVLDLLAEHYRQAADTANLLRILLLQLRSRQRRLDLDVYREIQTLAVKQGNWPAVKAELLRLAQLDTPILARIYLYEEDWPAAIRLSEELAGRPGNEKALDLLADGIKHRYPEVALDIYKRLVQQEIDQQSRPHYQNAAGFAAKIKRIYLLILNDKAGWQTYIENIRVSYSRRRALQEEFSSLYG